MFQRTLIYMNSFGPPAPKTDLYCVAFDKHSGEIVAIGKSASCVLADASEKAGLPKDCFEPRWVSREEFEGFCETG
jgi:hypothetical protein